jgi:aspartyl protease family protein
MIKLLILILVFLSSSLTDSRADTLYLKNGSSLKGFIKKENQNSVEWDVGCGTVTFGRNEIARIYKSSPEESAKIQQKWEKEKIQSQWLDSQSGQVRDRLRAELERVSAEISQQQELRKQAEPKKEEEVGVTKEKGQIVVDALLNNKSHASLVLDTGASVVLLTKEAALKAGMGVGYDKWATFIDLQLADSRKIRARRAFLQSVKIENVVAEDVEAAVLLDDTQVAGLKDGLLGMSFLSRFNFTVDQDKEKLILKEAK